MNPRTAMATMTSAKVCPLWRRIGFSLAFELNRKGFPRFRFITAVLGLGFRTAAEDLSGSWAEMETGAKQELAPGAYADENPGKSPGARTCDFWRAEVAAAPQ